MLQEGQRSHEGGPVVGQAVGLLQRGQHREGQTEDPRGRQADRQGDRGRVGTVRGHLSDHPDRQPRSQAGGREVGAQVPERRPEDEAPGDLLGPQASSRERSSVPRLDHHRGRDVDLRVRHRSDQEHPAALVEVDHRALEQASPSRSNPRENAHDRVLRHPGHSAPGVRAPEPDDKSGLLQGGPDKTEGEDTQQASPAVQNEDLVSSARQRSVSQRPEHPRVPGRQQGYRPAASILLARSRALRLLPVPQGQAVAQGQELRGRREYQEKRTGPPTESDAAGLPELFSEAPGTLEQVHRVRRRLLRHRQE